MCPLNYCHGVFGIKVNTLTLTLEIPEDKWAEIQELLNSWEKKWASLKDVQVLAGALNFACRCVKSGRVYLSCILNFLRTLPKTGRRLVLKSVKLDVQWWIDLAPLFNGISLMTETQWSEIDATMSSDSCLSGGGIFNSLTVEFIHWVFPEKIKELKPNINQLECLMVVIALKMWGKQFSRKKLRIHCDNLVTVEFINSGSSKDILFKNV